MASTIGIKVANGEFYSIVEENSPVKKRLVLTTVHDKQRSVQIDLYKSVTRTMADALYIGSLVVNDIKPRPKGEPSIEMVISSTDSGEITADAVDLDQTVKGEHQTLNVSLTSMEEDNREYDIPDFELENNESPPTGLYGKASKIHQEEKQGFPWLVVVCGALILAAIILVIWLLFYRGAGGPDNASQSAPVQNTTQSAPVTPAVPAQQTEPQAVEPAPQAPAVVQAPEPEPAAPAAEPEPAQPPAALPPVIQAPVKAPAAASPVRRTRPVPPVASYKVPSVIPKAGVVYKIRWGDTLWDIADAFYRNPWLYHRIARFNNIRNPDRIISGTTIRVPPRN